MRKAIIAFVIIAVIISYSYSCFATTAGNSSDPKVPYGPGISNQEASGFGPLKLVFDADWVFNKDLVGRSGVTSADIEGQKYLFRFGYTFFDRVEPYLKFGMSRLNAGWREQGFNISAKSEHGLIFGLGGKVLAFEVPEHRLRFSVDGQYIYTDPGVDKVSINNPNRSVSASEFTVKEWQVAGIVSMEFVLEYDPKDPAAVYSLIPYGGLGYINSDTDISFNSAGTNFDIGSAENDSKLLLITGLDITSPENVSLNIEGRWVGETAASAGFNVKF
ncbi:hypothetical protein ACFL0T_08475 [Candidatus Omnitrophota bacterium]